MLFPAQPPAQWCRRTQLCRTKCLQASQGLLGRILPCPKAPPPAGKDRAPAQVQSQLSEVFCDSDFCWGGIHRTAFLYLFKYPDFHNVSLSSNRNYPECAVTSLMHIIQYANFDCSYFNKSVKQINIHF